MSISGAVVVTMRYAARSSRIRRRNACGGSPATLRIIRSKWNREKWNRAAHSSPDTSAVARLVEHLGEVVDEVGEGVGGCRHGTIVRHGGVFPLDPDCALQRNG